MLEHPTGQIITFYSYKGGTGRTMALANLACLLARHNRSGAKRPRLLAIDWDFEAPGLHRYFQPYLEPDAIERFDGSPGCLELFDQVDRSTYAADDFDENRKRAKHWFESQELKQYLLTTSFDGLSIIKAGRFDDSYPRRVSEFRWDDLFRETVGLFAGFADFLRSQFDYILIDSRTGVTDTSGICTMLLPDKLVVVFTPNQQSITGIESLVSKAVAYRKGSPDGRPLTVFPLPSRIDTARPHLLEVWRNGTSIEANRAGMMRTETAGYQPIFERLFSRIYARPDVNLDGYFNEVMLQHIPDYAYGEPIAVALETSDTRIFLSRSYSDFLDRLIELDVPWNSLAEVRREREIILQCDAIAHAMKEKAIDQAVKLSSALIEQNPPEHLFERCADVIFEVARAVQREDNESGRRLIRHWHQSISENDIDPSTLGQVLLTAGTLSREFGDLNLATNLFNRSYQHSATGFGREHPAALLAMDHLASIARDLGNFKEAQRLNEKTLKFRRNLLGDEDPATLESMNNLAFTYFKQGDIEAARALLERVLVTHRRTKASKHRTTLELLIDGALALIDQRDLGRAQGLLVQIQATYRQARTDEYLDDFTSVSDLMDLARTKEIGFPGASKEPIAPIDVVKPIGAAKDIGRDLYLSPGYQGADKMAAKPVAVGNTRIDFSVFQSSRLDGVTLIWPGGRTWIPFSIGVLELSPGQTLVIYPSWLGW